MNQSGDGKQRTFLTIALEIYFFEIMKGQRRMTRWTNATQVPNLSLVMMWTILVVNKIEESK